MKNPNRYSQESSCVSQLTRTADDRKYILTKSLYELGGLAYEKSSWEGDYEIRDKIKSINEHLNNYYNTIRLFDSGKPGDLKAYEDILVYFQNNYIDLNIIEDKTGELKAEIARQKEIITPDKTDTGMASEKNKAAFSRELEKKIIKLETKLSTDILPVLNRFLSDVNQILLCQRIQQLTDQPFRNEDITAIEENIRNLRNMVITFLWLHIKINRPSFTRSELKNFIITTLRESGFIEPMSVKAGITASHVDGIAGDIAGEIEISPRNTTGDNSLPINPARTEIIDTSAGAAALLRLREVLKHLQSISIPGGAYDASLIIPEYSGIENLRKSGSGRFLFNIPGSYQVDLKWIADYLNNSLLFIYDWIDQESQKNPLSREIAVTLLDSVIRSDEFARAYATALIVSEKESNRKETFFEGEIHQYIPLELARLLNYRITETCEFLDEAFAGLFIHLAGSSSGKSKVLNKKIDIVHSSFRAAKLKIMQQIRRLKF